MFLGKVFGRYHGVTLSIFRSLFGGVAFGALRYVRDLRYFLGASYVLRKGTLEDTKKYPPEIGLVLIQVHVKQHGKKCKYTCTSYCFHD